MRMISLPVIEEMWQRCLKKCEVTVCVECVPQHGAMSVVKVIVEDGKMYVEC